VSDCFNTVLEQHGISLFPNSFPAKVVLVREQMQTSANFALYGTQTGPYWLLIWPLSERLAPLPLPRATRCNQHQSQKNSLLF